MAEKLTELEHQLALLRAQVERAKRNAAAFAAASAPLGNQRQPGETRDERVPVAVLKKHAPVNR